MDVIIYPCPNFSYGLAYLYLSDGFLSYMLYTYESFIFAILNMQGSLMEYREKSISTVERLAPLAWVLITMHHLLKSYLGTQ